MNIWDPFHPFAYFLHTTPGVTGMLGAILALAMTKGSSRHIIWPVIVFYFRMRLRRGLYNSMVMNRVNGSAR